MSERFRVSVLLDLYARHGHKLTRRLYQRMDAKKRLPKIPTYRVMAKLALLYCLLDVGEVGQAGEFAKEIILKDLPEIESESDRAYLHLLIDGEFHMRGRYSEWIYAQTRERMFFPEKLDPFLRKKISFRVKSDNEIVGA